MRLQTFMTSIKSSLVLKDLKKENKRKSLKILLEKLNRKQISIIRSLESSLENKELKEELSIISLLIKKGNSQLANLSL